jgi:hypothetical protein
MAIFDHDFDRTPLAMFNRYLPYFGRFWACLFHISRAIGQCQTPANLWMIENVKYLINERFLKSEKEQNNKQDKNRTDVLQLLLKATNSEKVYIRKESYQSPKASR